VIVGFRRGNFAFYDRGAAGNVAAYGQATAPSYNLATFPSNLPIQTWSGGIDGLSDPADVAKLLSQLPSSTLETHSLANYGHVDFIEGTNAHLDVYPDLIDFLFRYS
jgi:hypothetical protein